MSTKVYDGRRIPLEKLSEFRDFVMDYQFDLVLDRVKELLDILDEEKAKKWFEEKRSREWEDLEDIMKKKYKLDYILKQSEESAQESLRDPIFCLDCGWSFLVEDDYVYLRPWGETWTRDEIDKSFPEWVQEYGYWNNTDKPEGVDVDDWENRGEKWEEIFTDAIPMKIEIMNLDKWDSWMFERKIEKEILGR